MLLLWIGIDLSASIIAMDQERNFVRSVVAVGRNFRRTWMDRLETIDRRWYIFTGKKRGELVAHGHKGKGTTTLVVMDNHRTPLGVVITAANEHESQHIERLLDHSVVDLPKKIPLLYDKAADSDLLRERLALRGIELICPHRKNRLKPKTQDGRRLRRLKNSRWRIERTNSWLHNYGRFTQRKDRLKTMFLGWAQLACLFTIIKRF